jgi:hypothetical protein
VRDAKWRGTKAPARAEGNFALDAMSSLATEISLSRLNLAGTTPQAATALPDLVLDDVEIEGDRIDNNDEYGPDFKAGDEVTVQWDVDNIGNGSAGSSRVMVRLINDVRTVFASGANTTSSLGPDDSDTNESETLVIPANLPPGLYGIQIIADDRDEVTESNENNNEYLILIRVDAAGRPDLVIDNVELDGERVDDDEEYAVQAGEEITVTWELITTATAAPAPVACWCS